MTSVTSPRKTDRVGPGQAPPVPIQIPATLPVEHLSASSINKWLKCPEQWRKHYIEGERGPVGGALVLGSAVHKAHEHHFAKKVDDGQGLTTEEIVDDFASEFERKVEWEEGQQGINWDTSKDTLKDRGAKLVAMYHQAQAPKLNPVAVERPFRVKFPQMELVWGNQILQVPELDWTLHGIIDLETDDNKIVDYKVKARHLTSESARTEIQPTINLLARRMENNPASEFQYHSLKCTGDPEIRVVFAERTDGQLSAMMARILRIAYAIDQAVQTDNWEGAVPGSWYCGEKWCGFWNECPWGGRQ